MTTEYVSATRQDEQKAETVQRPRELEQKPREQPGDGSAEEEEDQSAELVSDSAEPDVLLDVPVVKVEEISLDVENLRARVSLFSRVGNLVALDVGAEAFLGKLKLAIKGVEAQALLKVRLQKVYAILERTLSTIDRNPVILASLPKPAGEAVGAIGKSVEHTVPQVGEAVGSTVEKTVAPLGEAVGSTVEKTVEPLGQVVGSTVEQTLPLLGQALGTVEKTVAPLGEAVGSTVEETVPALGEAVGSTVEKTVPALGQAVGNTVEQTVPQVGQAVGSTARETVDAATPRRDDHSRAHRVLRPIEKAARKCAAQVRRAVWTARQVVRARRGTKAVRDVLGHVPSPDNLMGK